MDCAFVQPWSVNKDGEEMDGVGQTVPVCERLWQRAAGAWAAHVGMFKLTEKVEKKFCVSRFLHTIIFFIVLTQQTPLSPAPASYLLLIN